MGFVSEVSVMVKIDVDDRASIVVEVLAQEAVEKQPRTRNSDLNPI